MKKNLLVIVFAFLFFLSNNANSNTLNSASEDSLSLNLNADFVTRYLWRGLQLSPNPNIQPYASISFKGLSFGAWGSYGLSTHYAEVDLYLSYSVGQFTFTVNDYYTASDDSLENFNYLNCKKSETLHALEGSIIFDGPESFPISLTAATFFAGYDDNNLDGKNDYSTYFELAYNANISDIPLKLFVGGTPQKGLYSDNANIVNVGINATKQLKFSNDLAVPAFVTLVINPNAKDIFFVFGLTF